MYRFSLIHLAGGVCGLRNLKVGLRIFDQLQKILLKVQVNCTWTLILPSFIRSCVVSRSLSWQILFDLSLSVDKNITQMWSLLTGGKLYNLCFSPNIIRLLK
jgi:hypothetical protein